MTGNSGYINIIIATNQRILVNIYMLQYINIDELLGKLSSYDEGINAAFLTMIFQLS